MIKLIKTLVKSAFFLALMGFGMYTTSKLPEWHTKYVRQKVLSRVVKVLDPVTGQSGGTGFHVKAKSGKTFIVTNHHVCRVAGDSVKPGDKVTVISSSGTFNVKKVVALYPANDLCMIEPLSGVEGLSLADSASRAGDSVSSVGHPYLQPVTMSHGESVAEIRGDMPWGKNLKPELCQGPGYQIIPVSVKVAKTLDNEWHDARTICVRNVSILLTTVQGLPGNSGSPLVDYSGNVIGVIFLGMYEASWLGAVPLHDLREFLSEH